MNGNDSFEEKIWQGLSGIKKFRKQKRVLKFDPKAGVFYDSGTGRVYVPGQGIVEGEGETEIILPCGHSASHGIGHQADCGHLICKLCTDTYPLVCAEHGCFRKFCTVKGCRNKPHMYAGLPFCMKHKINILVEMNGTALLFGTRRVQGILENMRKEYSLRHFQTNKQGGQNGAQKFPKQSHGNHGPAEKIWPA